MSLGLKAKWVLKDLKIGSTGGLRKLRILSLLKLWSYTELSLQKDSLLTLLILTYYTNIFITPDFH